MYYVYITITGGPPYQDGPHAGPGRDIFFTS